MKRKKFIGFVLVFVMTLAVMPAGLNLNLNVSASDDFEIVGGALIKYNGTASDVIIPGGVTSIGAFAFTGSASLRSVELHANVTSVEFRAFMNTPSLTSITVNRNNQHFSDTDGILFNKTQTQLVKYPGARTASSYSVPRGVTSIFGYAFYGGENLTGVTLPDTLREIGYGAFENCGGLTEIVIPDGVTGIGALAFANCAGLKSVTIGRGVTSIGREAFMNSRELTYIYFRSVTPPAVSAGSGVFDGVNLYAMAVVPLNSPGYGAAGTVWNGLTVTNQKEEFVIRNDILIKYLGSDGRVVMPGNITGIGDGAFMNNMALTSAVISNNVRSIGADAFSGCALLTSVNIPDSVRTIGEGAFQGCINLKYIEIPDYVTSIGENAFGGNRDMIIYARADSYADKYALSNNIDFSDGTNQRSGDGTLKIGDFYIKDGVLTDYGGISRNIVIPGDAGIVTIGTDLFYNSLIVSAVIPDGVENIGDYAFARCLNLFSVTIPDSVKNIGGDAFWRHGENLVIYAPTGSFAEYYAEVNNIKFIPNDPAVTASPSAQRISVNGREVGLDAYLINGSNYLKLRDMAYILDAAEKRLEIVWSEEANAILLKSGEPYTRTGVEMELNPERTPYTPERTSSVIYLDGDRVWFAGYLINGSNYFKLRDVMQALDVYVGWDGALGIITLDTGRGYELDD